MILTITSNPLLEKTLFFDKLERGKVNRAKSIIVQAGGKGVNVSRQLKYLGLDSLVAGFIGGENGKRLKSILYREEIKNSFYQINSETREGIVIVDNDQILESYFDPDPLVLSKEVIGFIDKAKKAILNSEMVIVSGSSPVFETSDDELLIFKEILTYANENDKFTLLDVYGDRLPEILKLKPDLVHVNKDEASKYLNAIFQDEDDIVEFLKSMYKAGIKIFSITAGHESFYTINQGYVYKTTPPEIQCINSTGSGDAFMAGIIYGLHHNLPFEEILRWATACGAANATKFSVCDNEIRFVEAFLNKVKVEKLN